MDELVKDIEFRTPPKLAFSDVSLELEKTIPANHEQGFVPVYRFAMLKNTNERVGHISFKVGDIAHIHLHVGHIGFAISPRFQGRRYAAKACEAIRPFVAKYYDKVFITADVDNVASIRTIEAIGAKLLDTIAVPQEKSLSEDKWGQKKLRFIWTP